MLYCKYLVHGGESQSHHRDCKKGIMENGYTPTFIPLQEMKVCAATHQG